MSPVNVKAIEGVFAQEQNRDMVTRSIEMMSAIEGESMRPVARVVIEGVKIGD